MTDRLQAFMKNRTPAEITLGAIFAGVLLFVAGLETGRALYSLQVALGG